MISMLYLTETRREGNYPNGDVLFASETNNVEVEFTSDFSERRTGFALNVRSVNCGTYSCIMCMFCTLGAQALR